jgi:hypothetical protein
MSATKAPVSPTDPTQVFTSFTNSAGQTFMIHGLSPMLPEQINETLREEWKATGKALPKAPTYTIPATEAHDEEIHEHTEKSLVVDGDPEQAAANQAAWKAYTEVNAEFQGEYSTRLMKKVFLAVVTPPTDQWRQEMEFVGVSIPAKGSAAEKYKFVQLEVIQSLEDVAMLQVAVLRLAGIIDEAAVDAAKASFRSFIKTAVTQLPKSETPEGDLAG